MSTPRTALILFQGENKKAYLSMIGRGWRLQNNRQAALSKRKKANFLYGKVAPGRRTTPLFAIFLSIIKL